jgi:NAD(P)-dependent dehydrogenase (short-subunit alcohol dehydrogenase family)
MRFADKVVVIFGGNSGIGRATAIAFAREGAQVVITGRNPVTLAETAQAIGGDVLAIEADISDLSATRKVIDQVTAKHGRIDVLFVNAGVGSFVPVTAVTPEFYDHTMGVNLRGPFFAVQFAIPLLADGASVILTASIGQYKGIAGNSVYAASKAGLRSLARSFGSELVERGIRVNSFSPGPIDTPLMERGEMTPEQVSETKQFISSIVPMKRFGSSEEAASTVLFLASPESSFVTGIDLIVDGGLVSF